MGAIFVIPRELKWRQPAVKTEVQPNQKQILAPWIAQIIDDNVENIFCCTATWTAVKLIGIYTEYRYNKNI